MPRKKTAISPQHLEKLKESVAQTFGQPVRTKPHCTKLSEAIFQKTTVQLSESTLRRCFGLVSSASYPSQQTLDVLAKFVGATSWYAFTTEGASLAAKRIGPISWQTVREEAQRISEVSRQRVKAGLGLPYKTTVLRAFSVELFNDFAASPQTALGLYAPSGAGKSTLLAHWVVYQQAHTPDIIWFVQGSALTRLLQQGFSLENWLQQSLGVSDYAATLRHFSEYPTDRRGTMWLVIDDFYFQRIQSDECVGFYRRLLSLIQEVHSYPWFKVVLSVQTPLWQRVVAPLRQQLGQQHLWYPAAEPPRPAEENIPLLSSDEVARVISAYAQQKPGAENLSLIDLPFHLQELLRFPFYLQLFLTTNQPAKGAITELSLVQQFVQARVSNGPYAPEKALLIQHMILLVEAENASESINARRLFRSEASSELAYEELLRGGILQETEQLSGLFNVITLVKFVNTKILACVIADYHRNQQPGNLGVELVNQLALSIRAAAWCRSYCVGFC